MDGKFKSVTYVGVGNVGSYALNLLARSGHFERLTLIEPDVYEARNLESQDIAARDMGRLKVDVVASRLRRINPALRVDTIAESVERVPPGRLRADVIATAPDNLAARRWVSRIAWRLGKPLVDAGVHAEGQLVRVDIVEPNPDAGCLECGWSVQETASLDIRHPCTPPATSTPTGAPAYLGALAASLQARECLKLLTGDSGHTPLPHQILMDVATHHCYVTSRRRSPDCQFDHRQWTIQPIEHPPGAITVVQALRLVPSSGDEPTRLRVHGDTFVHRLMCPVCHASRRVLHLASRLPEAIRLCPHCRTPMLAPGIDVTDSLDVAQLAGVPRRLSLYALGLRAGDVFSVETSSTEMHFQIGGR